MEWGRRRGATGDGHGEDCGDEDDMAAGERSWWRRVTGPYWADWSAAAAAAAAAETRGADGIGDKVDVLSDGWCCLLLLRAALPNGWGDLFELYDMTMAHQQQLANKQEEITNVSFCWCWCVFSVSSAVVSRHDASSSLFLKTIKLWF